MSYGSFLLGAILAALKQDPEAEKQRLERKKRKQDDALAHQAMKAEYDRLTKEAHLKAHEKRLTAWRTLRRGMAPAELRARFGEPLQIVASRDVSLWLYDRTDKHSVLMVDADDTLSGWVEPPDMVR